MLKRRAPKALKSDRLRRFYFSIALGAADPPVIGLVRMVTYRGFPRRLRHEVPAWVELGAVFHIRIALDRTTKEQSLIGSSLAEALLGSAAFYEDNGRWYVTVFLLMPDHLHALLSFAPDRQMSRIIADWKGFHARKRGIKWQEGFFDHRLRNDERGEQLSAKAGYIRRNPVAAGLCERVEDWPWVYPHPKVDPEAPGVA